MNARSMAVAYLMEAHGKTYGWDMTAADLAESMKEHFPAARELDPTPQQVARIARAKGWTGRLRGSGTAPNEGIPATLRVDAELESLGGDRGYIIGEYA
ncbi:hypothetical protein [Paracoccus sp. NSM]|uniref:hypothetical protein n=1 Tax=Paracoccus sp. NSM TaxID=3457784 RepID=UPI0040368470